MKYTLKDQFDKYELIFTPIMLLLVFILIFMFMPKLVPIDNFTQVFLAPMVFGFMSGIIITYLLDHYWKKASFANISDFLKIPTLALILLSAGATLMVSIDIFLSIGIIGFGLGNMSTIISLTSLIVYYRTYLVKEKKEINLSE